LPKASFGLPIVVGRTADR